jgi:hypothetical protein
VSMEMFFLLVQLSGPGHEPVLMPEKYTKALCDAAVIELGASRATCVPAPIGEYCKWHYLSEMVSSTGGPGAYGAITLKVCE